MSLIQDTYQAYVARQRRLGRNLPNTKPVKTKGFKRGYDKSNMAKQKAVRDIIRRISKETGYSSHIIFNSKKHSAIKEIRKRIFTEARKQNIPYKIIAGQCGFNTSTITRYVP